MTVIEHLPMPIITPRLILRIRVMADLDSIQAAKDAMRDKLRRWMQWSSDEGLSRQSTEDFIRKASEDQWEALDGLVGHDRATGQLAILTGIRRQKEPGHFNTGYWVTLPCLRQGYASEACNALIRYSFDVLQTKVLHIDHFEGNVASRGVIEKMGFRYTETEKDGLFCHAHGKPADVRKYVRTDTVGLPPLDVRWGEGN